MEVNKTFFIKLEELQRLVNNTLENLEWKEEVLHQSMEYSLLSGGKRLRPILMLSSYLLFEKDEKICIPYMIAMEMVHNFSLIHDDLPVIDNDDFRHGKLTNHKVFGESTAILAGDALLNEAYCVIADDISKEKNISLLQRKIKILTEFSKEVSNMILGEYIDIESEGKNISFERLSYMHQYKTGALIKESIRMGAILGGAHEEELFALTEYAIRIGLAFQIQDDILSEEGDSKRTGKPVGNDKEANKVTFISFYGVERSKKILNQMIQEAIQFLDIFGDRAWFLKALAIYIMERDR